jgi:4-amino-4-deoxy-L-arabinose transferase-like glycosyltransferase
MEIILKKMTSSESTTNSAENNKGRTGVVSFLASMPLSVKLFLLVIVALIPRIIVFLQPQIITIDGTLYIKMAKLFAEGKYAGTSGSYFSLYPFLIFLVQKVIGDWELSGQLISITLGTLTVIPIFLLGRSLYSERIGWLSGLFYVVLPNLLRFDIEVLRDPTYWFFMSFSLWLVWGGIQKNRPLLLGLASISAGLGAITRVDGVILWGALGFYAAFRRIAGGSLRRKALNVTLLIFVFPLIISPVLFSMKKPSSQIALGEMVSFSAGVIKGHIHAILTPMDPIARIEAKTYESLPQFSKDSLELASRHRFVLAISEVIYKFIKSANLLIVLIVLGLWKRKKERFESSDWYLLYAFAALFVVSIFYTRQVYYFSTRHGLTLVLPFLFFAGHGLDFIVNILRNRLNRVTSRWSFIKKYLPYIIAIVLVVVLLVYGISFKRTEKFIQKEIGLWLQEKGYQGSVIMGPKNLLRLAFYADGKFLEMPDSWEKVIDSIHRNGVRVVVIDSCTIEQDCPGFLINWPQASISPLRVPLEKRGKCAIQVYEVK